MQANYCRQGATHRAAVVNAAARLNDGFAQAGLRAACCARTFLSRCASILLITSGSSRQLLPALLYLLHPCSRMQAIILTAPPHSLQVSMSMLNTRFSLCAQVIDARCSAGVCCCVSCAVMACLPVPRWCYQRPVFAVGGEHPMKTGQMDCWFRVQCNQCGDEIQGFEYAMGGAIVVGCFELIAHFPVARQ